MEIIWGGFSGLLLLFSVYLSFSGGERWQKATLIAVVIIEVIVVLTVFLDWGYSWIEMSGLTIATERNIWILVPQFTGILILTVLLGSGLQRAWLAFMLAIFQTPLILYSIYMVELDIDMSIFTPAALICLGGSTVAATLLIPTVVRTMPVNDSPMWKIVFSKRIGILKGIKTIAAQKGINYTAPQTLFESGSASGENNKVQWDIQSRPSLWPPGYGLDIILKNKDSQNNQTVINSSQDNDILPNLSGCGYKLTKTDNEIQYSCIVRTPHLISMDKVISLAESLENFIRPEVTSA